MVPDTPQALHHISFGIPFVLPRVPHEGNYADFQIASKVTGLVVTKSPSTALLNQLIPKVPKFSQKRIFFIFLGAKLTIGLEASQGLYHSG